MLVLEGKTANEVWLQIADHIRAGTGFELQVVNGNTTLEALHAILSIDNPRQRWVIDRRPPMSPAFAIAEVVWIVAGRDDVDFLEFWNSHIREYVGDDPRAHGAYGHRLRKNLGIDQLERAFLALQNNPENRQTVLQIWDAKRDFPDENGDRVADDIPCNIVSLLKVRDGKLEWLQVIRSNDVFRGVPYNFVQFSTLQEIMAGWLGVEVGQYVQVSDSLHVYKKDVPSVRQSFAIDVEPMNSDSIACDKATSDQLFAELNSRADGLAKKGLSERQLIASAAWDDAPTPFRNMLLVLAAHSARENGIPRLGTALMQECTNPVLCHMWRNWESSRKRKRDTTK